MTCFDCVNYNKCYPEEKAFIGIDVEMLCPNFIEKRRPGEYTPLDTRGEANETVDKAKRYIDTLYVQGFVTRKEYQTIRQRINGQGKKLNSEVEE